MKPSLSLLARLSAPWFWFQRSLGNRRRAVPATKPDNYGAASFRTKAEKILAAPETNRGYWGMLVEDADTGEVLYSLNADRYFVPASNAKLFTTALALATLGPDYVFHTTIETRSASVPMACSKEISLCRPRRPKSFQSYFPVRVRKPSATARRKKSWPPWPMSVVARGVKKITGDVIGDDSYFAGGAYPSGWAIDDMLWNYGVPVSALEINDGTLFIEFTPGDTAGLADDFHRAPWRGDLPHPESGYHRPRGRAAETFRFARTRLDRNYSEWFHACGRAAAFIGRGH